MLLTQDINGEDVNDLSMPIQNGSWTTYIIELCEKSKRGARCLSTKDFSLPMSSKMINSQGWDFRATEA
jgi:hypothetical protein